jgi:hypothetical protein
MAKRGLGNGSQFARGGFRFPVLRDFSRSRKKAQAEKLGEMGKNSRFAFY